MIEDLSLADDLDCCPTVGDIAPVRMVPEDLCQRIVARLRELETGQQ